MRHRALAGYLIASLMMLFSITVQAAKDDPNRETDARMTGARVVEIADSHISVVARTGVEHVIAVDNVKTKVTIDGRVVSLKDVREGDIVTIELDAKNPMMFARNIALRSEEFARVRR